MTDFSLSHTTHLAPSNNSTVEPAPAPRLLHSSIPDGSIAEEDEDYTIKCICNFQEDDGNTVYCEKCETWQHIICYYGQKEVPDLHNCAECEPRSVDARRATERQRRKREQPDSGDRKLKKSINKSHKKKIKSSDQQIITINGWSHERNETISPRIGTNGSPKDHPPPAKRPKTSHRNSHSVHSQGVPSLPLFHPGKRSTSASHTLHSPSKTPRNGTPNGFHNELYSLEFLQLYENDPGDAPMQANLFNDIAITTCLSSWSHDVEELQEAANGKTPQDVFQRCNQPLDSMSFPQINKLYKEDTSIDYEGLHPRWTYLTIDTPTPQNTIVGELRGKIGHMKDYVQDPANRWDYLRHPLPFVFFHDQLPIYIDTRREGSTCRYLRRSCRPNLSMKTILENGSEYHFCFVANQDLEKDVELTIGWRLDEHISKFVQHNDAGIKQEVTAETAGSYVAEWVAKVLADFGGCACDDPRGCRMASYDRRNNTFSGDFNGQIKRAQHGFSQSSHSTGRATNSRSGSEALKPHDGDEQDDARSTSGSLKSKPRSRDMTPSNQISTEKGVAGGMEISGREKRKIAAMEKTFEQLEQDKQQSAQKKKKRNSGGSGLNIPAISSTVNVSYPFQLRKEADLYGQKQPGSLITSNSVSLQTALGTQFQSRHVDANTSSNQQNTSNNITRPPFEASQTTGLCPTKTGVQLGYTPSPVTSPATHSNYIDSSTQTDVFTDEHLSGSLDDIVYPRKPYISLKRRLLMRCHQQRVEMDVERETISRRLSTEQTTTNVDILSSPKSTSVVLDPKLSTEDTEDTEMQNGEAVDLALAGTSSNPPVEKPRPPDEKANVYNDVMNNDSLAIKDSPSPSSSHPLQSLDRTPQPINGHRTTELRVQLPPTRPYSGFSPPTTTVVCTPTSLSSYIAQSPINQTPNTYPPLFPSAYGMIQASPVKKKLSLGDYLIRRSSNKVDTLGTMMADKQHSGSSPTTPHTMLKPSLSLVEESRIQPIDENSMLDTPRIETDSLINEKSGLQE